MIKALALWNLFVVILFTSSWSAQASYGVVMRPDVINFGANLGMCTIMINLILLAFIKDN